jgi:chemotaxis protein methyltransferase CheR
MTVATRDDYVAFCEGIRLLCKIDLTQYKRGQMERRVRTFSERRGIADLGQYLTALKTSAEELEAFLDRITINVSQLWRNPEQWARLEKDIIPELAGAGHVRAWSAGCSYGAEAYTLAATCRVAAGSARVEISGTDIDARMVERARKGLFSADDARTAPADALKRFFDADDHTGGWQAKDELRRMTRFDTGDLLRMRIPDKAYDLVLCRNTVIYFNEEVRDALHKRLAAALRPGGYLVIGSTERVANPAEAGLAPTHPFVYRKS